MISEMWFFPSFSAGGLTNVNRLNGVTTLFVNAEAILVTARVHASHRVFLTLLIKIWRCFWKSFIYSLETILKNTLLIILKLPRNWKQRLIQTGILISSSNNSKLKLFLRLWITVRKIKSITKRSMLVAIHQNFLFRFRFCTNHLTYTYLTDPETEQNIDILASYRSRLQIVVQFCLGFQ